MTLPLRLGEAVFDRMARAWEARVTSNVVGTFLILSYVGSLLLIELRRLGWLPEILHGLVPADHFAAIYLAFTLLLMVEVMGLVFALAESVADSVGKQFELLSLILLRKAFLEFSAFGEELQWEEVATPLYHLLADAAGALLVFVVTGIYYRMQKHHPITEDEEEQSEFVAAKKTLAVGLLVAFVILAVHDVNLQLRVGSSPAFFEAFYVVLIFSDILIVLLSFRYSTSYEVVFRNSGFALATVLIRLALSAPPYANAALAVGSALFALGVTVAYNFFGPVMEEQREHEEVPDGPV